MQALFHRGHGRHPEGHFRGLPFYNGGVGQGHGDVHCGVAVNRPPFQGLADGLGDQGHKALGRMSFGQERGEGVAGAPGPGGQAELDFAEMAFAGQLPVENPGLLHAGGNGFPIDHLGAAGAHVGVELPLQAVDDDLQVQLSHAGQQGLARVFVGVDLEAGVLFADPLQARPQALLVVPGHRLDGQGDHRHVGRYGFQHNGDASGCTGYRRWKWP